MRSVNTLALAAHLSTTYRALILPTRRRLVAPFRRTSTVPRAYRTFDDTVDACLIMGRPQAGPDVAGVGAAQACGCPRCLSPRRAHRSACTNLCAEIISPLIDTGLFLAHLRRAALAHEGLLIARNWTWVGVRLTIVIDPKPEVAPTDRGSSSRKRHSPDITMPHSSSACWMWCRSVRREGQSLRNTDLLVKRPQR